jgi:hypothetical protein
VNGQLARRFKPLSAGDCNLFGMARALIADPELPNKARAGHVREIRLRISCNQVCLGRRNRQLTVSCFQNPEAGSEDRLHRVESESVIEAGAILIVGAGPARQETARACAARGHSVQVIEQAPQPGGNALLAVRTPPRRVPRRHLLPDARAQPTGGDGRGRACRRSKPMTRPWSCSPAARTEPVDLFQPALGYATAITAAGQAHVFSADAVIAGHPLSSGAVVVLDGIGHRRALAAAEPRPRVTRGRLSAPTHQSVISRFGQNRSSEQPRLLRG